MIQETYTDGISEAMNGVRDLYGEDRLCLCVEDHADLEPDALCDEIFESVREFADGAEQHDDMTMIVLKVGKGVARLADALALQEIRITADGKEETDKQPSVRGDYLRHITSR